MTTSSLYDSFQDVSSSDGNITFTRGDGSTKSIQSGISGLTFDSNNETVNVPQGKISLSNQAAIEYENNTLHINNTTKEAFLEKDREYIISLNGSVSSVTKKLHGTFDVLLVQKGQDSQENFTSWEPGRGGDAISVQNVDIDSDQVEIHAGNTRNPYIQWDSNKKISIDETDGPSTQNLNADAIINTASGGDVRQDGDTLPWNNETIHAGGGGGAETLQGGAANGIRTGMFLTGGGADENGGSVGGSGCARFIRRSPDAQESIKLSTEKFLINDRTLPGPKLIFNTVISLFYNPNNNDTTIYSIGNDPDYSTDSGITEKLYVGKIALPQEEVFRAKNYTDWVLGFDDANPSDFIFFSPRVRWENDATGNNVVIASVALLPPENDQGNRFFKRPAIASCSIEPYEDNVNYFDSGCYFMMNDDHSSTYLYSFAKAYDGGGSFVNFSMHISIFEF